MDPATSTVPRDPTVVAITVDPVPADAADALEAADAFDAADAFEAADAFDAADALGAADAGGAAADALQAAVMTDTASAAMTRMVPERMANPFER